MEYKGIYYKKKVCIVLENTLDECTFGEIKFIHVGKSKIPFLVFKLVRIVGFDNNFHAFEVEIQN